MPTVLTDREFGHSKADLARSDLSILIGLSHLRDAESARLYLEHHGITNFAIIIGDLSSLTDWLKNHHGKLATLLLEIPVSEDAEDLFKKLDKLAEYVRDDTRVFGFGLLNDITLYRNLKAIGFEDYIFDRPVQDAVRQCLTAHDTSHRANQNLVVAVLGLAGGVGASLFAISLAEQITRYSAKKVVILDAQSPDRAMSLLLGQARQSQETLLKDDRKTSLQDRIDLVDFPLRDLVRSGSHSAQQTLLTCLNNQSREGHHIILDCAFSSLSSALLSQCDHVILVAEPDLKCLNALPLYLQACSAFIGPKQLHIVFNKLGMDERIEFDKKDFRHDAAQEPIALFKYAPAHISAALATDYPSIPEICLKDRMAFKTLLGALGFDVGKDFRKPSAVMRFFHEISTLVSVR